MAFFRYPDYYYNFKCSGSDCTETCCQKWEIDVDEKTQRYYNSVPGQLGEYIRANLTHDEDGTCYIKMNQQGYCPFLDENHLCSLYIKLGQEHLSDICNEHPRYYTWYTQGTEAGVGLCCEEVAKMVLADATMELLEEETDEETQPATLKDMLDEQFLMTQRQVIQAKLQQQAAEFNIDEFANWLFGFAMEIQDKFDPDSTPNVPFTSYTSHLLDKDTVLQLIDLYLSLEINSDSWIKALRRLQANIDTVLANRNKFMREYPQVAGHYAGLYWYFIYRHFTHAFDDYDIVGKANLAGISLFTIHLLDVLAFVENGGFTLTDQVNICKLYSQEIEYDTDNTEIVSQFQLMY